MHRTAYITAYILLSVLLLLGSTVPAGAELIGCDGKKLGDPCDDDLFCTGSDTCGWKEVGGTSLWGCFSHTGDPCQGGPECANKCNEAKDNCFSPQGTSCTDDSNVCTDDECDGLGDCISIPNAAPCEDGLFCNGTDTCVNGACNDHDGNPCENGPACANTCDEDTDSCFVPEGTPCTDDGNVCTDNECDGLGVCTAQPNSDACDDALFCNGADQCSGGSCSLHTGDPCAGYGECALVCDEGVDACAIPSGTPCSPDGNPCTNDVCLNGGCTHSTIPGCQFCAVDADCDDLDPCTSDVCGVEGCEHTVIPGCGEVDDFKCYNAKDLKNPKFTKVEDLSLVDQFVAETVKVKRLFSVCAPVDNGGGGINDPQTHLCCYIIKAAKLAAPVQIQVESQFQASQVELKKAHLLCAPCTKTVLP